MTEMSLIRSELGEDGVLLATIDMPDRSMNVFSDALMDALEVLLDEVAERTEVRSVVITSGKRSFLAGADLTMVRGYTEPGPNDNEQTMFERCGRLSRLFLRLEASAKPWVAAVNGIALGGGLELAMACHTRVVSNEDGIQLGLPEVRWGLLPGAGGTQRLPRLVGYEQGLALLLSGASIDSAKAVALGLFAAAVQPQELLAAAHTQAVALQHKIPSVAEKFPHSVPPDWPAHSIAAVQALAARHQISATQFSRYPAYDAIISAVLLGAGLPLQAASAEEMTQFLRLMFNPVAGNMVRSLFLHRQQVDKQTAPPAGLKVVQLRHGPLKACASTWESALQRAKFPVQQDDQLAVDTATAQDSAGNMVTLSLRALTDSTQTPVEGQIGAWLSPSGPYGKALELSGAALSESAWPVLSALARQLGAVALRTRAPQGALATLVNAAPQAEGDALNAQALAALALYEQGYVEDPISLDVAACAAGVCEPASGGPFTHLWHHRKILTPALTGTSQQAWSRLQPELQEKLPV